MTRTVCCAALVVALIGCQTDKAWHDTGDDGGRRTSSAPEGVTTTDAAGRPPTPSTTEKTQILPSKGPPGGEVPRPRSTADPRLKFLAFPAGGDKAVATFGGDSLYRSQVFEYMLASMPDKVKASIAVLVGNRFLADVCEKYGIRVPEGDIVRWYTARLKVLDQRAKLEYGSDTTIERYLALTRGQTAAEFEAIEKNRERARRLMERAIRFHAMLEDRVELRIISLVDRTQAKMVREQLEQGADFATLAKANSAHPSAERGGMMYPVWRDSLNTTLQGPAFSLPVGAISDVIHTRDDAGRDRFQIVKIVRRHKGRALRYADVEDEIASDLQKRPLSQDEYLMWQLKINRMVEVLL